MTRIARGSSPGVCLVTENVGLSPGGSWYEAGRVHHASRRRGDGARDLAAAAERAAAGGASGRLARDKAGPERGPSGEAGHD